MNDRLKKNILKTGVLIFSITQLISPVFSSFNNRANQNNTDPQITPAGYTFSVWGIITILSFLYGVYQILPRRKNENLHISIAPLLIVVYILFSVWLYAAAMNWLIMTVVIFVIMLVLLSLVLDKIFMNAHSLSNVEQVLLKSQVAIYAGWSTVAVFANTGSLLKFYGLEDAGLTGSIWQSVLLFAALVNSIYGLKRFKGNWVYAGTILWAFVGVLAGLSDESEVIFLQVITSLAILVVIILTILINRWEIKQRYSS